jgi:hypothetical protein
MYDYKNELIEHKQYQNYISISEVIPDKRLYPSACCYQFCTMIASKGGYLPFTTWDDRYDDGFGFYGLTLNDFKVF